MVGHREAVKKQKQKRHNQKYSNAKHCDINNTFYRRLKRAMIACGHTHRYRRRRMWEPYANLVFAKDWLKTNGYSTFREFRKESEKSGKYIYLACRNPKEVSDYRAMIIDELRRRPDTPLPAVNDEYGGLRGVKGFDISTF